MRRGEVEVPLNEVYHSQESRQHPYSRSPIPRLPFRLRDRLLPGNPSTKRPWLYREVGKDAPLPSKLGPTTEAHLEHWQSILPASAWLIRCGRIEGVDDGLALIVLDVDDPAEAPAMPPDSWTVKTRRGVHWYTWTAEHPVKGTSTAWGELKADGGFVRAPGTRHPDTGQVYTPDTDFGKLVDGQLPLLPSEYLPLSTPQHVTGRDLPSEIGKGLAGRVPAPVRAAKGERWSTLRSLLSRAAGSAQRRGDTGLLRSLAHYYNDRFDPPMSDDRVDRLASDVARVSASWNTSAAFSNIQAARGVESGKARRESTRERNDAIIAARASGMTVEATAAWFGVSVSTVKRVGKG